MLIPLRTLLPQAINKFDIKNPVQAAQVCLAWDRVVADVLGKETRQYCQAIKFKGKTLFVMVKGSSWAQELQLAEKELIKAINKHFNSSFVEKILFRSF